MSAKGTGPRVSVRNVRQARVEVNGLDPSKGAPVEVKFAMADLASGYKNALVAAVTGKAIRVLSAWFIGDGTYYQHFRTGTITGPSTGGTQLTPAAIFPAAGKRIKDEHGLFQTNSGEALSVGSSNASATATVLVSYVLV